MQILKEYLTPLAVVLLAGVMLFDHYSPREPGPSPAPAAAVNGVALGRAYAPSLASTYADAWVSAAQALEEGKGVGDAQKALQETWHEARLKAFQAEVQPGFALVLPEGTEPADPAKRAQVAELWRSFAKGLKGGR